MKKHLLLTALIILSLTGIGQSGVATFGLQYKPIIPNRFIGTYIQDFNEGRLISHIRQKMGHSFGGVVRYGLNKTISLETGINLTQRNYGLFFSVPDSGYENSGRVRIVSYEIPLACLVYIQLSKKWYINTSLGSSITLFPSSVRVPVPIMGAELFKQEGAYRYKIQGAMIANVGFEFRSNSNGYFYFGSSYHLPYSPIMTFAMAYEYPGGKVVARDNVRGSYLTIDFRYFFNERPEKK